MLILIEAFKNVVAYNHMPYHPEAIASINDKIGIYDYDPTNDKKYHQHIRYIFRTVRENGYTNYKTARKTFTDIQCADKSFKLLHLF